MYCLSCDGMDPSLASARLKSEYFERCLGYGPGVSLKYSSQEIGGIFCGTRIIKIGTHVTAIVYVCVYIYKCICIKMCVSVYIYIYISACSIVGYSPHATITLEVQCRED